MKLNKFIYLNQVIILFGLSAFITGCSLFRKDIEVNPDFCSTRNPDFAYNGRKCCGRYIIKVKGVQRTGCSVHRKKKSYCDEMSEDQIRYQQSLMTAKDIDILSIIDRNNSSRNQSFCSVNDGFLVGSRAVVPTAYNRLRLRFADRCTNFGPDTMVGMIEWTGRKVAQKFSDKKYSKVNLIIADISTPRGGCIWGHSGRMSHASHTNGHDVDIGFLTPTPYKNSPNELHTRFNPQANWWLIKTLFKNPYTCVRLIFLDKKLIHSLSTIASRDPEWKLYRHLIQHVKGHHNHMHVRIGSGPDSAGCPRDSILTRILKKPSPLESFDEDLEEEDSDELAI